LFSVNRILPSINYDPRVIIEAGTPFIKREGFKGINRMRQLWKGIIVADLKIMDGARGEVALASSAGANAVTICGGAPIETINLAIKECLALNMISMIDMINVEMPMKILIELKTPPNVVILHKGRDEETTKGKVIQYKNGSKIKGKYDVLISAAGGVDLRESRSAIFNGANIVVVNVVDESNPWKGINSNEDVATIAEEFLKTIE
jgi:3-keto-L-gulonate-6-phosphate decarboxylase